MTVTNHQTDRQRTREELLDALAHVGGKLTAEEDIVFQGKKLIVPENMNLTEAIDFLCDKREEDEQEIAFSRTFNYRPLDGARATGIAMRKAFGMMVSKPIRTMFGSNPPQLVDINVSATETEQVPWGRIQVPLLPGADIYLAATKDRERGHLFTITVSAPKKLRFHIEGLFRLIEDELANNSMYRGKAFDGKDDPDFLDLRGFDPKKVVYSVDTLTQLDANIWSVIRYADEIEAIGMGLKRAILLEGPYGTGKTLAATWTARIAEENGWTFISCRPNRDNLMTVMQTARLYQPCVVFFEDVDTIADPSNGEDHVSELLDVFDGIQSKDTKIIVVLTTNHVERIHKGMVRPGRLDAVIHVGELDRLGYEKLIRSLVPVEKLSPKTNFDEVAEAFAGFMPAFAAEAIKRAMRYNVARNLGKLTVLETKDFVEAANGLRPQLELMNGAKEHHVAPALNEAVASIVKDSVREQLDESVIVNARGLAYGVGTDANEAYQRASETQESL